MTRFYAAPDAKEDADGLTEETPTTLKKAIERAGATGGEVMLAPGPYRLPRIQTQQDVDRDAAAMRRFARLSGTHKGRK